MASDKQKAIDKEDGELEEFAEGIGKPKAIPANSNLNVKDTSLSKAERFKHILLDLGFHKKQNGDDKEQYVKKEGDTVIGRTFTEKLPTGKFWAIQNDDFLREDEVKELDTVHAFYDIRDGKRQSTLNEADNTSVDVHSPPNAIMTTSPNTIINEAQEMATALYHVVEKQHLYMDISGKKYLQLEAWQLLGKFCTVRGFIESVHPVEYFGINGFEARAIIMDSADKKIADVEAVCMRDEPTWEGKPLFQLKSMAQTRALSKAYRSCLSFIVSIAGYSPTPLEEMQGGGINE
jgi:hypothetical protein